LLTDRPAQQVPVNATLSALDRAGVAAQRRRRLARLSGA